MKLYVIRHGKTNSNDQGVFNGRNDEDINGVGIVQATEASMKIKNLNIDVIIASPLLRTKHTARLINVNNVPVIYDELLTERDYGILTGQPYGSVEEDILWHYDRIVPIEGVEQVKDLFERVRKCMQNIKEIYPNKNILIVTHNGTARGINAYFKGLPLDSNLTNFGKLNNCEIKEYEW